MSNSFDVQLIEDENGELVLPIPNEIVEELELEVGDTLGFEVMPEGELLIFKVG